MLWQGSQLNGHAIRATDGLIGSIADLLFDDREWRIRWAVADSGDWLPDRLVLLPTSALARPDAVRRELPVDITRERVRNSPGLDAEAPISRRREAEIYAHYGWAPYWAPGAAYAGAYVPAVGVVNDPVARIDTARLRGGRSRGPEELEGDPHLRSIGEVTGYYIRARDGGIGHVEEFLIEDGSWTVRYLVIDTKNWWPGKFVLASPEWITDVSWDERQVSVDLTRKQVEDSPEYDPTRSVERNYEERLHGHYGIPPYWV